MKPVNMLVALLLLAAAAPAPAREVQGVNVPDNLTLPGLKKPLVLNGAGVRTKFFVKVYVGALYAVQPINSTQAVLDATTPRVMRLAFVRDVDAGKVADGWRDGFAANLSTFELRALHARLQQFNALMRDMKQGDVLRIDLLTNGNTEVRANDKLLGSVGGNDFQRALLNVWLGAKPADADLKRALLGGKT